MRSAALLLGDVVGMLSMVASVYLGASLLAPAYAPVVYGVIEVVLPVLVAAFAMAGLYNRTLVHPALEMQRSSAVVLVIGVTAGITLLLAGVPFAASALVVAGGVVGAVVIPVSRGLFRILFARASWWGLRTVVLSSGGRGAAVVDTLQRWPELGLRPVGLLTDDVLTTSDGTTPVLGGLDQAPYLAQNHGIRNAIVSTPDLDTEARAKLINHLSRFFDHVIDVSDAPASRVLWRTQRSREGIEGYEVRHYMLRPWARIAKRLVDVIGATVVLCAALPLLAVIAALIKFDSNGPVLYRQERMGREGRCFWVFKFRTMHVNAERRLKELLANNPDLDAEYREKHKLQDDPRVTTIGKVLRRYSLDELPQLLNVLRGDMSLVGPRAYLFRELPEMRGTRAEIMNRIVLQTPPGITGLWQVSGRNQLTFADRVDLDVHYIQNWSPWLDVYLLVRTIPVVLSGEGAC